MLRAHGVKKPNPRQQTLDDVAKLIDEMREKGFRPIVAMDANEDWVQNSHPREKERLRKFIERTQLADPYYEKFKESPRTFTRGPWRLDYILIDPSLLASVKRVGYLGSHEGNFSDHCLAYIDFDCQMLFRGQVNRPVEIGSREFMLEQTDKKLAFTCKLRKLQHDHRIRERVFKLARCFAEHGDTEANVRMYNKLDTEHKELVLSAARKAGHRKYGYMRSKNLVEAGQHVILLKALLDCKQRNEPPSAGCLRAAKRLEMDIGFYTEASYNDVRRRVYEARRNLWEIQKNAEEERVNWVEELAQDRTRAAGDKDWESKMRNMKRIAEDRAVDKRLTSVLKGNHSRLTMIQVPTHDWFYSEKSNELFHFTEGVFECYPRRRDGTFYAHHTLKVLEPDAVRVETEPCDPSIGGYVITNILPKENFWREVTDPTEINDTLLRRNKQHLQQAASRQGRGARYKTALQRPLPKLRSK
jgi:hypothetical protein